LSDTTRKRAFRYAEAYFKMSNEGVQNATVLSQMPEHLREDVLLELHSDLITACPWLQETSFACCCEFLMALRNEVVLRGDMLLKAGVVSKLYYILMHGELQVTFPPEGAKLSKLSLILGEGERTIKAAGKQRTSARIPQGRVERTGSLIGWGPPHGLARPLAYSARAGRDSSLLSIDRRELAKILDAHPLEASIFKRASEHAAQILNPIKKSLDGGGSEERLTADRRCSTKDMMQVNNARVTKTSAAASMGRKNSTMEEEVAMKSAADAGWLQSASPSSRMKASDSFNGGSRSQLQSNGTTSSYSVEEKMSLLFDELHTIKVALMENAAETAELRQIIEREGVGANGNACRA